MDVTTVKDAGHRTAVEIMHCKSVYDYPSNNNGASSGFGPSSNQLAIHLTGSPSATAAEAILTAIAFPTCTHSSLTITVNVGTYLVDDTTAITADSSNIKYVKAAVVMDESTGVLEVLAFEKTTGEYGSVPAGKRFSSWLKEYSLPASGTALTEIENFIY